MKIRVAQFTKASSLGLFAFVLSVIISSVGSHAAFADNRPPLNGAEAEARSLCGTERRGAIWFTNSGSYYGDTVVVEGNDNRANIPVGIRGSVYSCAQSQSVHTGATSVRADNPEAWRLTGLSGSNLDRGVVSGSYNWSTQGGQIEAMLNISGIAMNNNGRDDSQTIIVGIYRCFFNYSSGAQGACYTQNISVTVIRKSKPIAWNISASSTVRKGSSASSTNITATPGDRLTWTHQLRNNGPNATNQAIYSNIGMSGFTNGWATGLGESAVGPGAGVGIIRSSWPYTVYDVRQNDVGNTMCQRVQYDPVNTNGARDGRGNFACAAIPYSYTLNPTVTVPASEVEVGGTVTVSPRVVNSGTTKSKTTTWQLSYVTIPSGGAIPAAANSGSNPCAYYGGGGRTCANGTFTSGGGPTGTQVYQPGTTNLSARGASVADLPVGTQVCYALSVKDRASNSAEWRHSAPDCAIVSKRPVVQVTGGDLIVGRGLAIGSNVSSNAKISDGQKYGSWSEYGIVASGLINGMASARGYAGGTSVTNHCGVSFLSFSNKVGTASCADNRVGQYTFKAAASSIAGRFPTTSATQIAGDQAIGNLAGGRTYTNNAAGAEIRLTATASTRIGAGKWIVINAPGATVKIMNNIIYTDGPLTAISQIPQVVIIARNIIVADSVTQVDAWLVANGTGANGRVNTCGAGGVTETTALTSKVCTGVLRVNGPVVANHLLLRRTAGAGTRERSGDPAEVFNLRPDAYLWASNLQAGTTKAQTVMTKELPPRY